MGQKKENPAASGFERALMTRIVIRVDSEIQRQDHDYHSQDDQPEQP
jgi:hypothetical protein